MLGVIFSAGGAGAGGPPLRLTVARPSGQRAPRRRPCSRGKGQFCILLAMKLLNRLERTFAPYAIHNLTLTLVVLQSLAWCLMQARPEIEENLILQRSLLLHGQWW